MKKISILSVLAAATLMTACTNDKKSMITGKWQATGLENPQLDSLMAEQGKFLDTFGTHTTAEENLQIYGFRNVDSARQVLKAELADYDKMQEHAVQTTWFDFKKDGEVIMNFSGQIDTSNWKIDDAGALVLQEKEDKKGENPLKMNILSLTKEELKLQMTSNGMNSTVIFKPAGK